MKIENKLFKIELKNKKRGGAVLPILLCMALLAGMFGGGLALGSRTSESNNTTPGNAENGDVAKNGDASENKEETAPKATDNEAEEFVEGNYITSNYLASITMDKYKDAISSYVYDYGTAITGLSRDESIVLKTGFALEDLDITYWYEIANLYMDPELKYSVGPSWSYDEDKNELTISPSIYPDGMIQVTGMSTDIVRKYQHDNIFYFPTDTGTAWGNVGTLYLASYIDWETGKKLDKPQVQVVTIEGELADTPRMTHSFTDDGRLQLSWTQVEGAEEYFICSINTSEEYGVNGGLYVIANVKDNSWTSEAPEFGATTTNWRFTNYNVAEDDWYDEFKRDQVIDKYGETPLYQFNDDNRNSYCVIAISKEGTSMMSNTLDILDIQENIPVMIAYDTWRENGFSYESYDEIDDLMAYSYITMANGMTVMKLIDYDTENAIVIENRYVNVDEQGEYLGGEDVKVLKVPYKIEGTPFEDFALVLDYDEDNFKEDLAYIEEREDMLRKRAGEVTLNNDILFDEDEIAETQVREVSFEITANSALSEYLARNMLSGVSVIDLSAFDEAADAELLSDCLLEAYYQNALILGISGYRVNRSGTAVKVVYEDSAKEMAMKQEEIKEKVTDVISQIITPNMTDLEKELAINQYLCDTCEYDNDALANAEENEFREVDSRYKDSFTAYGALINGKAVCAGYAGAFKLLADAAGLECIVVTGMLEGNLPHAWNKVKIDGEWEILDVTNNDTEFLTNALLNLPDEAGSSILSEDRDYAMDSYLRNYAATNGKREYYRINDMYFDYDEISEKLADQINESGTALLRTEYALNDQTFNRIGEEVLDTIDGNKRLYGYYWMGVIYLTTKTP